MVSASLALARLAIGGHLFFAGIGLVCDAQAVGAQVGVQGRDAGVMPPRQVQTVFIAVEYLRSSVERRERAAPPHQFELFANGDSAQILFGIALGKRV